MTKRDADYFSQKYSLTRTHSEVLHAATIVPPGRALDLGCGNGRNSLYLAANGFAVTAWDKNPMSVNNLESIRAAGGYNLIVAAMDTEDYPCTFGFPFAFKPDELRDYYQGWELLKYNEDVGELHRTDANGNRIKLRFATLLARKPA